MRYLHSEDVIHRTLSANCIFLDEYFHPKITNLELLKNASNILTKKEEEFFLGIYSYSAPEIFQKKYTKLSDVYSFAMITYEILTQRSVYNNIPSFKIQNDVLNGKRPEITSEIPESYGKLIEECWSEESSKRPTFNEIVDRLKTDEFKSENIEINKFIKYVESLEEFERNNERHIVHKEIKLNENKDKSTEETIDVKETKSSELKFKKISVDFDQDKETLKNDDEQPLNTEFLDMSKFKLGDIISKQDYSKTYKIISKETGEIYSAKISTVRMNEFSRDELISLSREVNIISQLSHPSFLKFIGYSPIDTKNKRHPIIVTELAMNGTLRHILDCEREKIHIPQWNETTKLINIYGIASGMMYLHSNNILHRDLNPTNIYLDDYLFPKIGDFGLSTKNHTTDTMTYQSTTGLRGNPTYSSPEVLQFNDYSKSSDVYSFGFIVFEILSGEIPFKGIVNKNEIFNEVVNKENRPKIPEKLSESYRKLIEKCWSQERNERPSFEEIVELLKNDSNFITEKIKKEDYFNYIEFIDESRKSFDSKKKILDLSEFIQSKSKIVEDSENDINKSDESENESVEGKIKEEETNERKIKEEETNERRSKEEETNERKIKEEANERRNKEETIERKIEEAIKNDLNVDKSEEAYYNKEIPYEQKRIKVQEGENNEEIKNDSYAKEIEEESMNEIKEDIQNVQERSINKIEGNELKFNSSNQSQTDDVISIKKLAMKYSIENDTENTYICMKKLIDLGEFEVPLEYGTCLYKQGKFEVSMKYFKLLSKFNHPIANFFIGIMKYKGEGCKVDRTESYSILKHLSDNGIEKATEFIEDHFYYC